MYHIPDVEPDIDDVSDGMGKRDGSNSKLRRGFDRVRKIGQFRGAAQPAEEPLAFFGANREEAGKIAPADEIVITVKDNGKLVRLRRDQRIQLWIVQRCRRTPG